VNTGPGGIFISYRREDAAYPAGWLYDRLVDHFGRDRVFKDIDSIAPGDDFVTVLTESVAACSVLLVLIGPQWLTVTDDEGLRRLDDPGDFVRLEVEAALVRDVLVVPVLVGGAKMPDADDLPPSLAPLTRRQALELSPSHFSFETSRLLRVLDETLDGDGAAPAGPARRRRASRPSPRSMRLAGGVAAVVLAAVLVYVLALGPGSTEAAVFRDDFSSHASGWDDVAPGENGGRYANGAYRVRTRWTESHFSDFSFPRRAVAVFPSAPRDVRVSAVGRMVSGADQDAAYGVMCRSDRSGENYYQFGVWRDHVDIAKVTSSRPYYRELTGPETTAVTAGQNRLEGLCTTRSDGNTELVFAVNGQEVARAIDADRPLASGTVGLVVASDKTTKPIEAEFDDFTVARP
jgi:hypothetical protein